MSKTKHRHNREDYDDDYVPTKNNNNRHKEKRIDRALRTKNIDELVDLDDEGYDPDGVSYELENEYLDYLDEKNRE